MSITREQVEKIRAAWSGYHLMNDLCNAALLGLDAPSADAGELAHRIRMQLGRANAAALGTREDVLRAALGGLHIVAAEAASALEAARPVVSEELMRLADCCKRQDVNDADETIKLLNAIAREIERLARSGK